ncbi:PD-(D/E)XK nuclease family protein, partial [bacterium]|nr:PD-(D/E)XK nuclease family protein [bacterium]
SLPSWRSPQARAQLKTIAFSSIKTPYFKPIFTYTADIDTYSTCPRLYKFRYALQAEPVEYRSTIKGLLVHQTLEDINRAIIKEGMTLQEIHEHTDAWMRENYKTLIMAYNSVLSDEEYQQAREQIASYDSFIIENWARICQTEQRISLLKDDYVLDGQIDLILETPDRKGVELVDFKSSAMPYIDRSGKIEAYARQLYVYCHLMEERCQKKVRTLHLYFLGTKNDSPIISFTPKSSYMAKTLTDLDKTAHRIMAKDFEHTAERSASCRFCALKWLCQRDEDSDWQI